MQPNLPQAALNKFLDASCSSLSAELLVGWLKSVGVKCVAADFDLTMLSVHTGGGVDPTTAGGAATLNKMATDFKSFAVQVKKEDMNLCIATFSDALTSRNQQSNWIAGQALVKAVLDKAGNPFSVDYTFPFFPANYQTFDAYNAIGLTEPMSPQKSFHLNKVQQRLALQPQEIVLVDDDMANCVDAVRRGYLAVHVAGGRGFCFCSLKGVAQIKQTF